MENPVPISRLVPPKEKPVDEPDRYQLQSGIRFVITDFVFVDSQKYGKESIAKINGYDLITKQRLKYRTTAKTVLGQLKDLKEKAGVDDVGKLKQEVKVLVSSYTSKNGTGMELVDPT